MRLNEAPCHSRCDTIKIPPCSKALCAKHSPKFCSLSPIVVTSPYKRNVLERDVNRWIINQSVIILHVVNQTFFKKKTKTNKQTNKKNPTIKKNQSTTYHYRWSFKTCILTCPKVGEYRFGKWRIQTKPPLLNFFFKRWVNWRRNVTPYQDG
jgi:hypothetical protein